MDSEIYLVIVPMVVIQAIPPVIAYDRRINIGLALLLSFVFWPAAMVMVLRRPKLRRIRDGDAQLTADG